MQGDVAKEEAGLFRDFQSFHAGVNGIPKIKFGVSFH